MPTYQFEAMDATGQEIKDEIEANSEEEAQATIRQMGFFVTKISVKKARRAGQAGKGKGKGRGLAIGRVNLKQLTLFTRQLSILQDAGLPILRSLRILEAQTKPGRLKNSLLDVCEEIEAGATLSEAMAKSPKAFDRLYVNMIKAGEAGGALEVILRRLADFQERSQALRRKVKGAMIYPVVVVFVAVGILTFIMWKIVPTFEQIFADFEVALPKATSLLISISDYTVLYWYLIPGIPIGVWLFVKMLRKFKGGRMGSDLFMLNVPVFGQLTEKNALARSTRTLGTLVSSGVPILEALTITRETCGNGMFEQMFGKVAESIREGETIAVPLKEYSKSKFHPVAMSLWVLVFGAPVAFIMVFPGMMQVGAMMALAAALVGGLYYALRMNRQVVDDLVVNMVDVGEETGELDTMLYKVADTYDAEVAVLTDSLMSLLEPLLILFLGGAVGFIVISLFLPLVTLITKLSA
jgi:type IV pilus assembly protein PilC